MSACFKCGGSKLLILFNKFKCPECDGDGNGCYFDECNLCLGYGQIVTSNIIVCRWCS